MWNKILLLLYVSLLISSCASVEPDPTESADAAIDSLEKLDVVKKAGAPLFEGMSDFSHPITTTDPFVQRYFDQGMVLAFGFNHAESVRAFKAAQALDPDCAMCFWGEALAIGPNINVTAKGKAIMMPAERIAAFAAATSAVPSSSQSCGARAPTRATPPRARNVRAQRVRELGKCHRPAKDANFQKKSK